MEPRRPTPSPLSRAGGPRCSPAVPIPAAISGCQGLRQFWWLPGSFAPALGRSAVGKRCGAGHGQDPMDGWTDRAAGPRWRQGLALGCWLPVSARLGAPAELERPLVPWDSARWELPGLQES